LGTNILPGHRLSEVGNPAGKEEPVSVFEMQNRENLSDDGTFTRVPSLSDSDEDTMSQANSSLPESSVPGSGAQSPTQSPTQIPYATVGGGGELKGKPSMKEPQNNSPAAVLQPAPPTLRGSPTPRLVPSVVSLSSSDDVTVASLMVDFKRRRPNHSFHDWVAELTPETISRIITHSKHGSGVWRQIWEQVKAPAPSPPFNPSSTKSMEYGPHHNVSLEPAPPVPMRSPAPPTWNNHQGVAPLTFPAIQLAFPDSPQSPTNPLMATHKSWVPLSGTSNGQLSPGARSGLAPREPGSPAMGLSQPDWKGETSAPYKEVPSHKSESPVGSHRNWIIGPDGGMMQPMMPTPVTAAINPFSGPQQVSRGEIVSRIAGPPPIMQPTAAGHQGHDRQHVFGSSLVYNRFV